MKRYREKFVPHLDTKRTMFIPTLDFAKRAVWFYHGQIITNEASTNDLVGLATDLDTGHKVCTIEAQRVYRLVVSRST